MRARQLFTVLLILAGAGRLAGQDRPAAIVTAPAIRYPEVLRAAGIGGIVRAEVVVHPGDTVAPEGVRVISTPHRGFNNAVLDGLRHWTYRAATRSGSAVVDTLVVVLTFEGASNDALAFGPMEIRELVRDSAGVWRARIGPLLVSGKGAPLIGVRRDSAGLAAARYLAQGLEKTPGGGARIACVTLRTKRGADPLTSDELAALQAPGVAIVHPGRCPPKFASMVYIIGRVIPPGNDPSHIVVQGAQEYPDGWILIRVEAGGTGAGYDEHDCLLRADILDQVMGCVVRRSVVF